MENIYFGGSCRKCIFDYNFTDRAKCIILFHLQTQGADNFKYIYMYLKMFGFFVCIVFFYWNEIENVKTTNMTVQAIQFLQKDVLFQPPRSKTVGEDVFLGAKVQFFRGRKTILFPQDMIQDIYKLHWNIIHKSTGVI